jgi:trigger factor
LHGERAADVTGELPVKVNRESNTSTEVTLNIEMESADEDPFIDRSYRRTVNRLSIPGFRKGKAPRSIVESYVGRTALLHEALEFMIPETLDRVLQEQELKAFAEPDVEVLEIEPVSFKAVVPLEPVVELGDYHSIRIESEPVNITEEQVNEVIERIQGESAPWEPVDRPARYGDLLNLTVSGIIDGEEVVNDSGVDYIPEADNVLPFPGFSVYLEGMTEGQEKDFVLTIPEEYPRPQYAGKECHFHVEVLSIKEKALPELDDEFAKGVGEGFDSLEALREHVRNRLTEEQEVENNRQLETQSLEALVGMATIQASDMLYQRELESMQRERERLLSNQRLDLDTYLRYIGQTEEEFQEQLRPSAQERLTRYLVLRKLAQEENIEVSPEEMQEEIDSLIASSGASAAEMRRALSSEGTRESIRSSLINRKVMQRLTEIARGSAPEAAAPEGNDHPAAPEAEEQSPALASTEPKHSPEHSDEGAKPNVEQST